MNNSMSSTQKDEIMLDAISMVIKLVSFHDHASGERYQKMMNAMTTILMFCVDFKSLDISQTSEFLDNTFGAIKMMILKRLNDDVAEPEPTKQ
ncbi:MAG: hypothetical protein V4501_11130 [Pseudomonadota bacterium]